MYASWLSPSAESMGTGQRNSRSHRITQISTALILASFALVPMALVQAGPARPVITSTTFTSTPQKLSYFQDSPVVLMRDYQHNVHRSPDEGKTWYPVKGVPQNRAKDLVMHAFDPQTAFILTDGIAQYKTNDYGETWTAFVTPYTPIPEPHVFSFHAKRKNRILITLQACERQTCHDETYYTEDGFLTSKKLLSNTHKCAWAMSSPLFDEAPEQLVHCLEYKSTDGMRSLDDVHMVQSQDYFETKEKVVFGGLERSAIVNFVTKEKFMLAAE
ncbi:vacuolar protein sorting/targeting protein PEP1, partial [Podila epigama]